MFYCGKQLTQTGGAGDWRSPSRVVYDPHYYTPAIGVISDGVAEVRRAGREHLRGRPRLHLTGHQPRPARGRGQHRTRQPDG
jgi:hypothetical protein